MEKRSLNKGFTLVECCIVMVALSIFVLLAIPAHDFANRAWYLFPATYYKIQSEAILFGKRRHISYEDIAEIDINMHGNVKQAKTITFPNDKRKIVIELGGGRLVEK